MKLTNEHVGRYVKLRNGNKVKIYAIVQEPTEKPVFGMQLDIHIWKPAIWRLDGTAYGPDDPRNDTDIISLWEEPIPLQKAPEKTVLDLREIDEAIPDFIKKGLAERVMTLQESNQNIWSKISYLLNEVSVLRHDINNLREQFGNNQCEAQQLCEKRYVSLVESQDNLLWRIQVLREEFSGLKDGVIIPMRVDVDRLIEKKK